jgi:addiction module HigA family antidote
MADSNSKLLAIKGEAKARTAIHPGEHLVEALEEIGMSARQLTRAIPAPANRISGLMNGQRTLTADTALRLDHYFNISPQFWLNLQQLYDLRITEARVGREIEALPQRAAA